MEHGKQGFFYKGQNLQEAFLFCDFILSGQLQYIPKPNSFFEAFASTPLTEKYTQLYV
jgi:hypothetical protein